jgi:tetratricopeptide (TPR) repeat protein
LLDSLKKSKLHKKKYFWAVVCILITTIVLSPNLFSDFLNWDDTAYVINNDLIKNFSFDGFKQIFYTPEVVSTYAPLTLISWSIDYAISGLNPAVFHATNLLLHLLIVCLVLYLTELICKNKAIAVLTAILFGIHPMHVEVVGWISARKDLLYTLFFICSLITYYFYAFKESRHPKYYYYVVCFVFYIMSLLSKGSAVILPLVLFLFDYLNARKFNLKLILEKVPFFLLSIFFVLLSIKMQAKGGAMEDRQFITVLDSLSVGFYGYITYMIKVIVPFNLSAYHPYPNQLGDPNPWYFYAASLPIVILFIWLLIKIKKNRTLVFGFGFFFITLIPVIQVLPFGTAVTADRYTYLPYFGLFYLIGTGCVWFCNSFNGFKKVTSIGLSVYLLTLGVISFQYSKTFNSSEKMWTNVIEKYPNNFLAYMNRAEDRISKTNYSEALKDLNLAINLNPNYAGLYYNRSFINNLLNRSDLVFEDLNMTIQKDKNYMVAYLNRGILYGKNEQISLAIKDFTKVIELSPNKYFGYYNRAVYNEGNKEYDKAIQDLNRIIELDQFLPETHYLRGKIRVQMNDVNNAFKDFSKTLEINPAFAGAHTQRGNLWLDKGNFKEALKDYNQAILLDQNQTDAYINRGVIHMNLGNYNKAGLDFEKAKKNNPKNYLVYYNKGLLYQIANKYKKAIIEFDNAIKYNPSYTLAIQGKMECIELLNK